MQNKTYLKQTKKNRLIELNYKERKKNWQDIPNLKMQRKKNESLIQKKNNTKKILKNKLQNNQISKFSWRNKSIIIY